MKKWTKIVLLTGLICATVGLIICIVTTAFGAGTVFREMNNSGVLKLTKVPSWATIHIGPISIGGDDLEEGTVVSDLEEAVMVASAADQIDKLDLEIGGMGLVLTESADENFYLLNETRCKINYKTDGSTLVLESENRNISTAGTMYLAIPRGYHFEKVEIELGAGSISNATALSSSDLKCSVGAGEIILSEISVHEAKLEMGAGKIELSEAVVTDLDTEVAMGDMRYQGSILGNVKAECSMGKLDLQLEGKFEDFDYNVECGAGSVNIDDMSFAGSVEQSINNHADKKMKLECDMGNISIEF